MSQTVTIDLGDGKTRALRATLRYSKMLVGLSGGKTDDAALGPVILANIDSLIPAMMSTADREGVTADMILDMDTEVLMGAIAQVSDGISKNAKASPATDS